MEQAFLADGGSWKKFNLKQLFGAATRGKRLKSADRISGSLPFVTAGEANTGISDFIGNTVEIFPANTITIDMFGSAKYRNYEYGADDHIAVIHTQNWSKFSVLFLTTAIHRASYAGQFSYSRNFYAKDADELDVMLPEKNGEIAFNFMETVTQTLQAEHLQELQAYLQATGLSDYVLSKQEKSALDLLENVNAQRGGVKPFKIKELFGRIQQGERLTKADQISGSLNFVMSGTTNTGIVGSIGNAVVQFPKNSITIDIFGNVFYRNDEFGASDDVGVYWNNEDNAMDKHAMLYLAASLRKSLSGRFDYGYKLRASKSHNLTCLLPEKDGKPDTRLMSQIGRAIEKLVIADVVKFNERELAAYRQTIQQA